MKIKLVSNVYNSSTNNDLNLFKKSKRLLFLKTNFLRMQNHTRTQTSQKSAPRKQVETLRFSEQTY